MAAKRYEALIVFHNPTSEDGIKEMVDKVSQDIEQAGGSVENVQKMDRKAFSRVTDKKVTSGFYTNLIFTVPSAALDGLQERLRGREEVYRVMISNHQPTRAASAPPAPALA